MSKIKAANSIKSLGAEFWDVAPCGGNWSSYRQFMNWIQRTEPYFFEMLDSYSWQGKKVVDVGCGQGTTLNYLPQYGAQIVGLDMSYQSILTAQLGAKELGVSSSVAFLQADAENLPFAGNGFDVAISCGVLHHTVDTADGVRQLYRMLKPGGIAIVMLYRSRNPKWWVTKALRKFSRLTDFFSGRSSVLVENFRQRQEPGSVGGTALLELFGVPILKAFSNRQARAMFAEFSDVRISNHQPGFRRLADILPGLRFLEPVLSEIDRLTRRIWGFYQVIEARK